MYPGLKIYHFRVSWCDGFKEPPASDAVTGSLNPVFSSDVGDCSACLKLDSVREAHSR